MSVTLLRPYQNYTQGSVVNLGTEVENALIIQGIAVAYPSTATATSFATNSGAVTSRAPTLTDDVNAGYAISDYWQYNGNLWQATRVTANYSVWNILGTTKGYLLDRIASTPIAAYGLRKLRAGYVDNECVSIRRASDGTSQVIGFIDDVVDFGAIQAFAAGTTFTFDKWFDQIGTNDLTQTTAANQPLFDGVMLGDVPTIRIAKTFWFTIPAGVAIDKANFSVACIGRADANGSMAWAFQNGAIFSANFLGNALVGDGVSNRTLAAQGSALQVAAFVSGTGVTSIANDTTVTGAAYATAALTAGRLGSTGSSEVASPGANLQAFIVWNSALATARLDELRRASYQIFDVKPQTRDVVFCVGDSITWQATPPTGLSWPVQLADQLIKPCHIRNVGVSGYTFPNISTALPAWIATVYRAGVKNIAVLFAGTNDIFFGATANQTYANFLVSAGILRAAGFKVIATTILPRNQFDATMEAYRLSHNALLRTGWASAADALLDFAADPTIGLTATLGDTSIYTDGTHLSQLGLSYPVPRVAAAVNAFLT